MKKPNIKKVVKDRALSKTYWFGIGLMSLSYVQDNFTMVETFLGEYSGLVYIGIGLAALVLREYTTKSLSEKTKCPDSL